MGKLVGTKCGLWYCEQEMGSGAFGSVTAWINQNTGDKMVIKQCRHKLDDRNRERWLNEIKMMNDFKHKNIVAGRSIPKEIKDTIISPEKLLGLEYCESDLRKLLSHRLHCCGLKERIVLNILKDVSQGLEFLHKRGIIHRDLKPENILLFHNGGAQGDYIYKITDLGYAKEMDANSLFKSFVGTVQYLAPELYNVKPGYDFKADFWSLGTLIFECITGRRPFLLTTCAIDWPKYIMQKNNDDIWGYYDEGKKDVVFFSDIPKPNSLCKPLLAAFQEWLKIVLRYNPRDRGETVGGPNGPLLCFVKIREILDKKIIKVFNVFDCVDISYVCRANDTITTLKKILYGDTMKDTDHPIPEPDQQMLVSPTTGEVLHNDILLESCLAQAAGEIYLLKGNKGAMYNIKSRPPDKVRELVGNPELMRKRDELRLYWAQASFYCNMQATDYLRLLMCQRSLLSSLQREWDQVYKLKNQLNVAAIKLETVIEMFTLSLQYDRTCCKDGMEEWDRLNIEVQAMKKFIKISGTLDDISRKNEEYSELQKDPTIKEQQKTELDNIAKDAGMKYDKLRQLCRDSKEKEMLKDSKTMCQIVMNCIFKKEQLYEAFYRQLKKVMLFKTDLACLSITINECIAQIYEKTNIIKQHQQTRQGLLWKMFSSKNSSMEFQKSGLIDLLQQKLDEESIHGVDSSISDTIKTDIGETFKSLNSLLGVDTALSDHHPSKLRQKSLTFDVVDLELTDKSMAQLQPRRQSDISGRSKREIDQLLRSNNSIHDSSDTKRWMNMNPIAYPPSSLPQQEQKHTFPPGCFIYMEPNRPPHHSNRTPSYQTTGGNSSGSRYIQPTTPISRHNIGTVAGSSSNPRTIIGDHTVLDPRPLDIPTHALNPSTYKPVYGTDHILQHVPHKWSPVAPRDYVSSHNMDISLNERNSYEKWSTHERPAVTNFTCGDSVSGQHHSHQQRFGDEKITLNKNYHNPPVTHYAFSQKK